MSMTELKLSFATEKLEALRFFMEKKQQTPEKELQDYLDKAYERVVPAQVREYLEMRVEQASSQQQVQGAEQTSAPRERERPPARQTRRQREQAAAGGPPAPEPQTGTEGHTEGESQGMNMSM
ncbi:DUF6103 family protein [Clostridium sp. BNL1100]|uniref:DUF6103 family protein n=1 Tax=Clostridium sp. BNL1100 TaxID=755731 RepID=UPI00024A7E77|nr:DUF6103 family protein [Clostridium sp. BNL1100]AEY67563.1 hypothetical protein Clo1100_3431 [Clostridium sp. BNL1100]